MSDDIVHITLQVLCSIQQFRYYPIRHWTDKIVYLRYLVKWNITFHTFVTHSSNIIRCIKRGIKHKVDQVQRMQTDSHKVCSKCPPLARTQARKRTGHWSTASSVSDSFKPRHTCSRRCRSSPVSSTWQSRHIYITCKINKQIPYLQRAFIPVCSYVKNIKIHQGFPQLWSKIYCHVFYEPHST